MMTVKEKVYEFKTKNREGFVQSEIDALLKEFANINFDKFKLALSRITCMMINDEIVIYHTDIINALNCGIDNRLMDESEWD